MVPAAELPAQGQMNLKQNQAGCSRGLVSPVQDHSDGPFWFAFALCPIPLSSFFINFSHNGNAMNKVMVTICDVKWKSRPPKLISL